MIISAFKKIAVHVYSIDGEESFINSIKSLKAIHKYVMVYSMAQDLTGNGLFGFNSHFPFWIIEGIVWKESAFLYQNVFGKGIPFELKSSCTRIDFRIRDNVPYVEDIGANPTVSEANGVNQLYCHYLSSESLL